MKRAQEVKIRATVVSQNAEEGLACHQALDEFLESFVRCQLSKMRATTPVNPTDPTSPQETPVTGN